MLKRANSTGGVDRVQRNRQRDGLDSAPDAGMGQLSAGVRDLDVAGMIGGLTRDPPPVPKRWPSAAMYFTGVTGLVVSATAMAEGQGVGSTDPTWIWSMAISAALAVGGWFLRGMHNRIAIVEHDNKNIWAAIGVARATLAENHHTKAELAEYHNRLERETREHRERVETSLQAMNARLDLLFSKPRQ